MDSILARKMWRTLEPFHGLVYFTPYAAKEYDALGADSRYAYFASRAAPMGAVSAEVIVATFFNFNPAMVRPGFPGAWETTSPSRWVGARFRAVDSMLREALGADVLESADMIEAADLARQAADACTPAGRALYAGHAALTWPEEPHLVLWHGVTLVREFRGDGHIAALVCEGLDGCEALVTHGAAGEVAASILQSTRGWSDSDWAAAASRLEDRGWIKDGVATAVGNDGRARIEALTDDLAMAPWQHLGEDGAARLRELVRPWSRTIVRGSAFADVRQIRGE